MSRGNHWGRLPNHRPNQICRRTNYPICIPNAYKDTEKPTTAWKEASITLVHKKRDIEDMKNYRSISLIPVT